MEIKHILHLYNRIGFGITPNELYRLKGKSKKQIVEQLFWSSKITTPLTVDSSTIKNVTINDLRKDVFLRQNFFKSNAKKIKELNVAWVNRLFEPKELLREKMTLFWTNHFVCNNRQLNHIQTYSNTIRENALGNFGSFIKIVSKEPAMLEYLNNKQNRKDSPNENFARELMELFTLGQGNYTEKDIKESARAFTGYFNNLQGEFRILKKHQDKGEKVFFGKKGNFDGDDIIDIILTKKQCAKFICEKLYRYFVNDKINKNHLNEMIDVFYLDYNIEKLMKHLLLSDWFYGDENIGVKIKSPIELIVSMHKVVSFSLANPKQILLVQKLLGQVLLYPPNVAGWNQGKGWIDSNTIVTRLRMASVLLNNQEINYSEKGDFKDVIKDFNKSLSKKEFVRTNVDWNSFEKNYKGFNNDSIANYILSTPISNETRQMINQYRSFSKKDFCLQLLSLPEYQLC